MGSVSDGSITDVKVAAGAAIDASKLAADSITATEIGAGVVTEAELADEYVKGAVADTTGAKTVIAIGWDDASSEVVVDHEV